MKEPYSTPPVSTEAETAGIRMIAVTGFGWRQALWFAQQGIWRHNMDMHIESRRNGRLPLACWPLPVLSGLVSYGVNSAFTEHTQVRTGYKHERRRSSPFTQSVDTSQLK
jgi:hypothetical protein